MRIHELMVALWTFVKKAWPMDIKNTRENFKKRQEVSDEGK